MTARQKELLDFIADSIARRGYPPTYREIGEAMGIRSPNAVWGHVKALRRRGLLETTANTARGFRLLADRAADRAADPPVRDDLPELAPRQRRVLAAIVAYRAEHQVSPAVRDLMRHFGYASPHGITCHLRPLARKGYVRLPGMHGPCRGLQVLAVPPGLTEGT